MDSGTAIWTRRQVLRAAAASAVVVTTSRLPACSLPPPYAVAAGAAGLQTFRIGADAWQPAHTVPLPAVAHLAVHPSLPVVYACHEVAEHGHLPRGAVSAWSIGADGTLQRLGIQPLSLGALHPHFALAVSGGSALLVLTRAGIYNLLPIAADGSLRPVSVLRKEHGGPTGNLAAPQHAVEHPDGTLLTVDSGQEVVSRFQYGNGCLALQHRTRVHAGGGARRIALSRCGQIAYTLHAENGSIGVHRVTPQDLQIAHRTIPGTPGEAGLLLHPHRPLLLRAGASLAAFALYPADGAPALRATLPLALHHAALLPDASRLIGLHRASAGIVSVPLREYTRVFGRPRTVATVPGCRSLAFPPTGRASA